VLERQQLNTQVQQLHAEVVVLRRQATAESLAAANRIEALLDGMQALIERHNATADDVAVILSEIDVLRKGWKHMNSELGLHRNLIVALLIATVGGFALVLRKHAVVQDPRIALLLTMPLPSANLIRSLRSVVGFLCEYRHVGKECPL
jgi:hypothetical protein